MLEHSPDGVGPGGAQQDLHSPVDVLEADDLAQQRAGREAALVEDPAGLGHRLGRAAGAAVFWVAFVWFFRSPRFEGVALRQRQILKSFREAKPSYYFVIMAMRSPACSSRFRPDNTCTDSGPSS